MAEAVEAKDISTTNGTGVNVRFADICQMKNGLIIKRTTYFFKPDV